MCVCMCRLPICGSQLSVGYFFFYSTCKASSLNIKVSFKPVIYVCLSVSQLQCIALPTEPSKYQRNQKINNVPRVGSKLMVDRFETAHSVTELKESLCVITYLYRTEKEFFQVNSCELIYFILCFHLHYSS